MGIDLSEIGMEKGCQYETIITTHDNSGNLNASPFGVICRGPDKVMCRIFKGSRTLENIISQQEFTVNITQDPLLFTWSLLDNLQNDDFDENLSLKDVDCYFECRVTDLIEAVKKSDPIKNDSEAIVIKAEVAKLVVNTPVKVYNRAFSLVVESLVHFSRIDIADDIQKEKYFKRIAEARRVIKKVGSKSDKKAIDKIVKKMKEKGYEI